MMYTSRETDPLKGELYLAGERVPPGIYRDIESRREICFDCEDFLPASLDGRVACYEFVLRYGKGHTPHNRTTAGGC